MKITEMEPKLMRDTKDLLDFEIYPNPKHTDKICRGHKKRGMGKLALSLLFISFL